MRALFALAALAACADPDPTPTVEVGYALPEALDPADDAADDLTITVYFSDGDGDLGGGSAVVTDCRVDDLAVTLALPPIASDEAVAEGVPIDGTLDLLVADVGWLEPAGAAPAACDELGVGAPVRGEVVFCVALTDAAGHTGDGDCTDPIPVAGPGE